MKYLVVKTQGRVEVLSIAQHLLKCLPAGVVVTGRHKKLLYLLKLVYSAQERRTTPFSSIIKAMPHFVLQCRSGDFQGQARQSIQFYRGPCI